MTDFFGTQEFLDASLVRPSHVARKAQGFTLVWPTAGAAAALDVAAASILECFTAPFTPRELIDDLVTVIGLPQDQAERTVRGTLQRLSAMGQLIPSDSTQPPDVHLHYPPFTSP